MAPKEHRENAKADKQLVNDWSPWQQLMKPGSTPSPKGRRKSYKGPWMPREGGVGWRLKFHKICDLVPASECGVYELRVESSTQSVVVYLGSTCQDRYGRLVKRIFEYAKSGSHKKKLIDGALRNGYSISFRFRKAGSKMAAEKEENKLLERYNYAWNKRNNGAIRHVV